MRECKQKITTFHERWIADGIKEDYKEWHMEETTFCSAPKIFIESPTGTGKTSFILKKFLPYAAEKNQGILYFTNRTSLKQQIQNTAKGKRLIPVKYREDNTHPVYGFHIYDKEQKESNISIFKYPHSAAGIIIMNYQSAFHHIRNIMEHYHGQNIFSYIIFDEAHFFLADALFNSMTGLLFDESMEWFKNSTMIFMSATLSEFESVFDKTAYQRIPKHPLKDIYAQFYSENIIKYYNSYTKSCYRAFAYQNNAEILNEISESNEHEKWLIFVTSKNTGNNLKNAIISETNKTAAFITAEKKNTGTWRRLIDESCYETDVLITTKVLDNGINIIDNRVRHIVLPFCDKTAFIQMLGRRRCEENEIINIYINQPTIQILNVKLIQLNKIFEAIKSIKYDSVNMTSTLQRLWSNCDKSINNLFYIDYNRNLVINSMGCRKAELLFSFYWELKKNIDNPDFYLKLIENWLENGLKSPIYYVGTSNCNMLDEFIELYLDNPIPKEEQETFYASFQTLYKKECAEKFANESIKLKNARSIRKRRTTRKAIINKSLATLNLPYEIKKEKNCWVLKKFRIPDAKE